MRILSIDPGLSGGNVRILGVDPGLSACGMALLIEEGHKKKWQTATIRIPITRPWWERARAIARRFSALCPDLLVIEQMQVYEGRKRVARPADLMKLAVLAGMIMERVKPIKILHPTAAQWKGGIPKETHHKRIRARVPDLGRCSKDALDAVGLALYGKEILDARPKT